MSEQDPHREEDHIDHQPLRRFEADLHYATSFYDLYNAFTTYLASQFDIPEEAAMQLYASVSRLLPGADLFGTDVTAAHQQMRLGLMRVALPLAEGTFGTHDDFGGWVRDLSRVAMDPEHSGHDIDECVVAPRGVTEFSCHSSDNCPVKVVKHALIVDSLTPDFRSLDYQEGWASEKIQRTIAKLSAAQSLGLIVGHEASTVRSSYLLRAKAHAPFTPENDEI